MSIIPEFIEQVIKAKEAGEGLTLTPEQTAALADEIKYLQPLANILTDEDIARMSYEELFNTTDTGISLGEVVNLPEFGAWADWDIGDSAEYVSNLRRKTRYTW